MTLEQAVHSRAVRLTVPAVVGSLRDVLGQWLSTVLAGVSDPNAIGKWVSGQRVPGPDTEQRLRHAFQIVQLLSGRESAETVCAWMVGMNPDLGDRAPALILAEDPVRVLQAARAFIASR